MRPTSVGNVQGVKRRDKNKLVMSDLLTNSVKNKAAALANHNISVNLGTKGQLFEEDTKINNNSFILRQGGSVAGLENLIPSSKVPNNIN
jgi:hypothetical protein